MSAGTSRRYPPELRERAVRMFTEIRNDHESEWVKRRVSNGKRVCPDFS